MENISVISTEQFEELKKEVYDWGLYRQEQFELMILDSTESSYDFDWTRDGFSEDFRSDLSFCCEELNLNEKDLTDEQYDELREVWSKANKKAFELACEKEGVEYEGGYEFSNKKQD